MEKKESRDETAARISKDLIEKHPGVLLTKAGIRLYYGMHAVKAAEVFILLLSRYGFTQEGKYIRVPKIAV